MVAVPSVAIAPSCAVPPGPPLVSHIRLSGPARSSWTPPENGYSVMSLGEETVVGTLSTVVPRWPSHRFPSGPGAIP